MAEVLCTVFIAEHLDLHLVQVKPALHPAFGIVFGTGIDFFKTPVEKKICLGEALR